MASIDHLFHIEATQEEIFNAITTIDGLKSWWTTGVEGESAKDKEIKFYFGDDALCRIKVLEIDDGAHLSWLCVDGHSEWVDTFISFDLSLANDKVQVQFSHSNWQKESGFMANCNFSWGRYLVSLKELCEKGTGNPYQIK